MPEKKYYVWSTDPALTSYLVGEMRKDGMNVEAQSEPPKAEARLSEYFGPGERAALSQADGYAESSAEDGVARVREDEALTLVPSGFAGGANFVADGAGGIAEQGQVPGFTTPRSEAHQDVLSLARQFLAEPVSPSFYASSNPGADGKGTINALNDIFGTVREVIEFSIPSCRSKSLALTKLDEASMWANKAVARKK